MHSEKVINAALFISLPVSLFFLLYITSSVKIFSNTILIVVLTTLLLVFPVLGLQKNLFDSKNKSFKKAYYLVVFFIACIGVIQIWIDYKSAVFANTLCESYDELQQKSHLLLKCPNGDIISTTLPTVQDGGTTTFDSVGNVLERVCGECAPVFRQKLYVARFRKSTGLKVGCSVEEAVDLCQ